jgi:hypothetical protein
MARAVPLTLSVQRKLWWVEGVFDEDGKGERNSSGLYPLNTQEKISAGTG